jgi:dTDP-4-dehydrorhamnose reductase
MRIHITGASGFLGRELAVLAPAATVERVEIRDRDAVHALLGRLGPDVVIHTAYRQDGEGARDVVVEGSTNVALGCAATGARLVHLSTDVVFDGRLGRPYREDDPPSPCTAYGEAKAEAEARVAAACPTALIVRTSLIIGGLGHAPSKHEEMALDESATFFDNEVRSPVQVTDLARALLFVAAAPVEGLLHLGGEDDVSRADLAELVRRAPVRRMPAPPTRPLDCRLDSARARAFLPVILRGARTVLA